MFDEEQFLSAPTEGEMSTSFIPVPEGEWPGRIEKVSVRTPKESTILDVYWAVDDESVRETTGMENPTVRQSIFLDLTDDGNLDAGKGKNIQLGRLREAVGQNGPEPWAPSMLVGNVGKVRVEHRQYEGNTYADVKGVTKL